jgi:hypothetical protein
MLTLYPLSHADPTTFEFVSGLPSAIDINFELVSELPSTIDLLPFYKGDPGTPGVDGAQWITLSGSGTVSGGNDGDFALHTDTGDLEQNLSGTWTVVGNLKGPAGSSGAAERIDQAAPSASWVLSHSKGRVPGVQLFLASGEVVYADIIASDTVVSVEFASAQTGFVILT